MLKNAAGATRDERSVPYCPRYPDSTRLVMDSRTNAGHDQVNDSSKMHTFAQPGERVLERGDSKINLTGVTP